MSEKINSSETRFSNGQGLPNGQKNDERNGPLHVLILEDNSDDAELIQAELRRANLSFLTRCVKKRDDFLFCLQEFRPDIVLSDFLLPGFDGLEALKLVKTTAKEMPFILVTGSQSEEVAVQCLKEGADDYILKTTLKRLPSALINAIQFQKTNRQRLMAMEALRRSEEHFRSLIENAMDIILILNQDSTVLYASPSMRSLGYSSEELTGKHLLQFISPDDTQAFAHFLNSGFTKNDQAPKTEFVFRHSDGSFRVLEAIGKAIQTSDTNRTAFVINARDVTERKQAEDEIEKLAEFPKLNPNPVFELNGSGQLTYWNKSAQDYARSVGCTPGQLLPEDTSAVVAACLQNGKSETKRETTIGNRVFSWSFFPIIPSQVVHCYAIDITERVALEAHMRQSQKMESIGQLAAGIAHDFNNALTVIQGYTDILLKRETDLEMKKYIQQISQASERASNLTRQLLTFSHNKEMQTCPLDVNQSVADATLKIRNILGENIALHFNYSPNLPLIEGDRRMVEEIIMNLAANARDALPLGGVLSIGTSLVQITHADVQNNMDARVGGFVCLRIGDNGTGIDPSVLPHIFEPFFTTKEVGKGDGLGLATVYGIVQQLQGWIDVVSAKGQGTTFRVFLPVQREAGGTASQSQTNVRQSGQETILVVEDEADLRSMICGILRNHGYNIVEASSDQEALNAWANNTIDLLFTDLVMPGGLSGIELGKKLKSEKPNLKIIYTSGYSLETMPQNLVVGHGLNFLQKPYHPSTLVKFVRTCLDEKSGYDGKIGG